jgi:hypothetical protein
MKKFVLFVLLSSLFGFSQEKTTTQDFGLNPKPKQWFLNRHGQMQTTTKAFI